MTRLLAVAAICLVYCATAMAGGAGHRPMEFVRGPFAKEIAAGRIPGRIPHYAKGVYPLLIWLQLSGRYTPEHVELFQQYFNPDAADDNPNDYFQLFIETLEDQGYTVGEITRWRLITREEIRDGQSVKTSDWVHNCRTDAFRTAYQTFMDRRTRYGVDSPALNRWVDGQLAVFRQCGADLGEPPDEPDSRWQALERHDRLYQIGAWHFYRQSYLKAAGKFREIGETVDSPWRKLAQYLVPRSLARHGTINTSIERPGSKRTPNAERVRYLEQALAGFEGLAADDNYLAEFPSVMNQIMHIRTALGDRSFAGAFERQLIENPSSVDSRDIHDYDYLNRRWQTVTGRHEEYAEWLSHFTVFRSSGDGIVAAWRAEPSLPYTYLALIKADERNTRADLRDLLTQTRQQTPDTPGYLPMLGHRLRIAAMLGDSDEVADLKSELARKARSAESTAMANEIRLQIASAANDWPEYVQWTSLLPPYLSWSDEYARSLPTTIFNRITRETRLFPEEATKVIDIVLTPQMVPDLLTAPDLSDYQRNRLAIAGWIRALLEDDLQTASEMAVQIRKFAPHLVDAMSNFETAQDPYFEAAWIVLLHPGLSPWVTPGAGRTRYGTAGDPASDRLAVGFPVNNWWCKRTWHSRWGIPSFPYFARSTGNESMKPEALPTAAEFFGGHVIRYARDHLDDPRVPKALHRVVFATRHSCETGPGHISKGAFELLHKHFADSEWAEKTPYWFE